MKEIQRTPIERLTDALAEMTERATVVENERDKERESSSRWYQKWSQVDKDYKELQGILNAEIQAHQKTKGELEEAVRAVEALEKELASIKKNAQA